MKKYYAALMTLGEIQNALDRLELFEEEAYLRRTVASNNLGQRKQTNEASVGRVAHTGDGINGIESRLFSR